MADVVSGPGGRLGELTARPGTDAVHRIDLLTAVMHELGHLLGHEHAEHGLMQPVLGPGFRWLPEAGETSPLAAEQALLRDIPFWRRTVVAGRIATPPPEGITS